MVNVPCPECGGGMPLEEIHAGHTQCETCRHLERMMRQEDAREEDDDDR